MKNIKSQFADKETFNEIMDVFTAEMQKAAQTTTTTEDIIQVEYEKEIKTSLISEAPFLRFLEEKGRVKPSTSAAFGWYTKDPKTGAEFIAETGDIPSSSAKEWDKVVKTQKVITYPISVSMMAQLGNTGIDLINDDIQDGFKDIAKVKNTAYLLGDSSVNSNSFDGIDKLAGNKSNIGGEAVTMEAVDNLIDAVINKGGTPDAIVTTARSARQLTTEQQKKEQKNDTVEFVPGGWVRSYYAPTGQIPVITDPNLVTTLNNGNVNPGSEDKLFVIDSSALISPELMPISEVDLARTKLTNDSVLANFVGFGIPNPEKLGVLSGIGSTASTVLSSVPVTVKDSSDDSPISGAVVEIEVNGPNKTCTTGPAGGCNITNIETGTYDVEVSKSGYDTYSGTVVIADNTTLPFELDPEEAGG